MSGLYFSRPALIMVWLAVVTGSALFSSAPANANICDIRSGAWPCFSQEPEAVEDSGNPADADRSYEGDSGFGGDGFFLWPDEAPLPEKQQAMDETVPLPVKKANLKPSPKSGKTRVRRARRKRERLMIVRNGVSTRCFPPRLRRLVRKVVKHFGQRIYVTSGHRSAAHNRRIGGARRSWHIKCSAVDFRVRGVNKYVLARFLKKLPGRGGVGTYCGKSTVHLDTGPRRAWHWGCRKPGRYIAKAKPKNRTAKVDARVERKKVSTNAAPVVKKRAAREKTAELQHKRFNPSGA